MWKVKQFFIIGLVLLSFSLSIAGQAATIYTGDVIQALPVVSQLDVDTLARARTHKLYVQTIKNKLGNYLYVPVTVIRGATSGKKLLLITGMYGDENLSQGLTIHLREEIKPEHLVGTVIIVHALNQSGLLNNYSGFKDQQPTEIYLTQINNFFSEDKTSRTSAGKFAKTIWKNLFKNNADFVIHATSCETDFQCAYVVTTDSKEQRNLTMAKALLPDVLYFNSNAFIGHASSFGEHSILYAFASQNIPGVELQIAKLDSNLTAQIKLASQGMLNLLRSLKMLAGEVKVNQPLVVDELEYFASNQSGYTEVMVAINQWVEPSQLVAKLFNQFGKQIASYSAEKKGQVIAIKHYPLSEQGYDFLVIANYNPDYQFENK